MGVVVVTVAIAPTLLPMAMDMVVGNSNSKDMDMVSWLTILIRAHLCCMCHQHQSF